MRGRGEHEKVIMKDLKSPLININKIFKTTNKCYQYRIINLYR